LPSAKNVAAPKFTTSAKNVRKFGLMPVAATPATIFISNQPQTMPIHRV